MNPRPPAPPFVLHSKAPNHPQTPVQPPIVIDVQRLVEHMRVDFRAELQTFKADLLVAIRQEFQKVQAAAPVFHQTTTAGPVDHAALQRALSQSRREESEPLFVPSDLLAPREGTVEVKTSGEGTGSLDDAAEALKRMKRGKK